jgi:hypothetical protein
LRIIADHEHFVPLNLPVAAKLPSIVTLAKVPAFFSWN